MPLSPFPSLSRCMVWIGACLVAVAGLLVSGGAALADLRVCNKTSSRVSTAIGYRDTQGWVTEGWWTLDPVSCQTILTGPLGARYYYVYALDADQGGWWSGESFMCTQHRMFKIRGIDKCGDRGYERTGFLEIDTGEQRSWTVQLTEPPQQP